MTKLTEQTLIPLGLTVSAGLTLLGAAWWASATYARVEQAERHISQLQQSHTDIVKELREVNGTLVEIKTVLKRGR